VHQGSALLKPPGKKCTLVTLQSLRAPLQLVDKRRDLVRVQRVPSFSGINIQVAATHVLSEDDAVPDQAAGLSGLKGGDGYGRLLEYRCGRYLYSEALNTFLPIPGLPADFDGQLHRVASSRNIQSE
jgi:hypothetical protein